MSQSGIEEIEHTADWAIRVRAHDVRELFVRAAAGMFGLLADASRVRLTETFDVTLSAIDVETLLVDWLNELLFMGEEQGLVFFEFDIDQFDVEHAPATLHASARGGRPDELFKVIKAATFGGLSIKQDADGVVAEIVFDV